MSDSFWSSSSVSGDNQGSDMNSSDAQIEIYVDRQLRHSFSVSKALSQYKQEQQIYSTLSDVLFDDNGDSDIILNSVQITTTRGAKPIPTDELNKYTNNSCLLVLLSTLLAKEITHESDMSVWFMTPAGQVKAAQDALPPPPKRAKNSHDKDAVPLEEQFVYELVADIAQTFMSKDDIHSKICVEVYPCLLTHILGPNRAYHDIAKRYVAFSTLNTSSEHYVDTNNSNCLLAEH